MVTYLTSYILLPVGLVTYHFLFLFLSPGGYRGSGWFFSSAICRPRQMQRGKSSRGVRVLNRPDVCFTSLASRVSSLGVSQRHARRTHDARTHALAGTCS